MPTASSAGNVSKVPDPTTALIVPAPIPATRMISASYHVIVVRLYAPVRPLRPSVQTMVAQMHSTSQPGRTWRVRARAVDGCRTGGSALQRRLGGRWDRRLGRCRDGRVHTWLARTHGRILGGRDGLLYGVVGLGDSCIGNGGGTNTDPGLHL